MKEESTSYSHLSQGPHPFCTKGCNSFRLSGGFRNQSIAVRLCTEELPCSNSSRVCAMAATCWRSICKEVNWTETSVQFLWAVVYAYLLLGSVFDHPLFGWSNYDGDKSPKHWPWVQGYFI
ncbi:hypothetical protein AVEN_86560-1 [Araneus ventricosus]|uniref:Uncharacterized protein n=1 Tax=Araneus ventricosus TaxID=182803 RepID=A0A4Y2SUW5_ARAVE|nr:hypothetical protein AVEN_86560-1 [Araneus ventricosus]